VIPLFGGAVTAASRTLGHWISFGTTLAMMLGMTGYMAWSSRKRSKKSHFHKYGPTYLVALASLFIMADLSRHVLEDTHAWPAQMANGWGAAQYKHTPECDGKEVVRCLTKVGWLFTIVFTYLGFFLLIVGTLWNSNITSKIRIFRAKWQQLRGVN